MKLKLINTVMQYALREAYLAKPYAGFTCVWCELYLKGSVPLHMDSTPPLILPQGFFGRNSLGACSARYRANWKYTPGAPLNQKKKGGEKLVDKGLRLQPF